MFQLSKWKDHSDDRMTEVHDVFSSSIASISIYMFCSLAQPDLYTQNELNNSDRVLFFLSFIDIVIVVQTADNAMTRQNSNHFVIWVWCLLRMRTTFHRIFPAIRRSVKPLLSSSPSPEHARTHSLVKHVKKKIISIIILVFRNN